ncbi:MAG: hypothetical protein HQL14_08860, partial [Candidatus Omnitrophica bacterium]|nr:hypothetical protein [Candidatus Omnitrophota bacterium]
MIKKLYFPSILALIMTIAGTVVCHADNYGDYVDAPVTVGSSSNTFGSAFESEIIGGYQYAANLAGCNAILSTYYLRMVNGALCYAVTENKVYRLFGGTPNPTDTGLLSGTGTWEDTMITTVNTSPTAGNVGIGTNIPMAQLQVGPGTPQFFTTGPGNEYVQNDLEVDGTAFLMEATIGNLVVTSGITLTGGSTFDTLTVKGNTYLAIQSGNVGVGTTLPAQKFDVEGTSYLNGNVGIGSASPTHALDVQGTVYVAKNIGIGTASPNAKLQVLGGGANIGYTSSGGTVTNTGNGSLTVGYALVLGTSASVSTSGSGDLAAGIAVSAPSGGAVSITSQGTGSLAGGYSFGLASSANSLINSASYGSVAWGYANNGTINATGNGSVAMGYGDSVQVLQSTGTGSVALGTDVQANQNGAFALGQAIVVSGTNSFGIGLDSTPRTIAASNVMAIMGGNVGIGSVSPAQKLDVEGTAYVNGNVGIGTSAPGTSLTLFQRSTIDGFQFTGNSIGGTNSGTGFVLSLGVNISGNKQFWFGDYDGINNGSYNFLRIQAGTSIPLLDGVTGNNGSRAKIQLGV